MRSFVRGCLIAAEKNNQTRVQPRAGQAAQHVYDQRVYDMRGGSLRDDCSQRHASHCSCVSGFGPARFDTGISSRNLHADMP